MWPLTLSPTHSRRDAITSVLAEAESLARQQKARHQRIMSFCRLFGSMQDETLAKQTALNQMVLQWHRHCRAKDRAELLALKGATRNMFNQGAERVAKSSINAAVKSCCVALLAWGHERMSWGWAGWQHSVRENKRRAAKSTKINQSGASENVLGQNFQRKIEKHTCFNQPGAKAKILL